MDSPSLASALQIGGAAFVIALTGAMAPGPLLTVTIDHTIRRGGPSAMLLLVGHALLEAALLAGLAFGLRGILLMPPVVVGLSLVGGGFLVWMGGSMLLDAVRGTMTLSLDAEASGSRLGPVLRGAAVSISNPYWTIWWATVGLKIASDAIAVGPVAVGAFFIGHELADFAWYALIIAAVAKGRHLFSDRWYRTVSGACATFLVFLGGSYMIAGIRGW